MVFPSIEAITELEPFVMQPSKQSPLKEFLADLKNTQKSAGKENSSDEYSTKQPLQ